MRHCLAVQIAWVLFVNIHCHLQTFPGPLHLAALIPVFSNSHKYFGFLQRIKSAARIAKSLGGNLIALIEWSRLVGDLGQTDLRSRSNVRFIEFIQPFFNNLGKIDHFSPAGKALFSSFIASSSWATRNRNTSCMFRSRSGPMLRISFSALTIPCRI